MAAEDSKIVDLRKLEQDAALEELSAPSNSSDRNRLDCLG